MAETWEMLLKHQQERVRQQTLALADQFRNVLFLSDHPAANEPAKESNNEEAASASPHLPARSLRLLANGAKEKGAREGVASLRSWGG